VILPDYLAPGLRVVFVGTAVSTRSAARGHYYAGPGNEFWRFLHASGLTPTRLRPDDDHTMPSLGFGLTDLAKTVAQSHDRGLPYDFAAFTAKIGEYRPGVVAFTSKQGATVFARSRGERAPGFGVTPWLLAGRPAFVLPSPSAANRAPTEPPREYWWRLLAGFLDNTDNTASRP
jgi:TDG/mug DNA glycosylase family protein